MRTRRIRNFYERSVHWLNRAWRAARNYIRAGQRYSRDRSDMWGEVGEPYEEITSAERREIVRKCHIFEGRNAIVNQFSDLIEQYAIGPHGLQFIPSSSDIKWNAAAKKFWDAAQENIDLTSLQTFGTLQALIARAVYIRDGESFALLTHGTETRKPVDKSRPEFPMPVERPRVQIIESHRIATPPNLQEQEGVRIFDGVRVDDRRRPIGFYVRDVHSNSLGIGEQVFRYYTTDQLIQMGEPSRAGEFRFLPLLYPVLDDIHDLDDLQTLGMRSAKNQSRLANVIKNSSGEFSPTQVTRNRFRVGTQDANANAVAEDRLRHYKQVLGAETIALRKGEEFEQAESKTPSQSMQWLLEYITWKICAGVGIPKILVYPQSIQGTVSRGEYDRANAFFRARSAALASFFKRIYLYFIEWGINNIPDMSSPPSDWRNCTYRPPRAVNVDVGRNSAAKIAELESGGGTLEGWYAELGEDYVAQLTQKAREAKLIHELAKEFGVTPGEISKPVLDSLTRMMEAEAAKKQAEHSNEDEETIAA